MDNNNQYSDIEMEDEIDSEVDDNELQKAFQEGRLKPGLNVEQKPKRPLINNKVKTRVFSFENIKNILLQEVLTAKYTDLYLDLPWIERLDCTNAAVIPNETEVPANEDETLADNDFKREMLL